MIEPELKFPIDFKECPNCGSNRRIAEIVTNEEIEKGNLKPGQRTPFIAAKALVFDPKTLKIITPNKEVLILLGFFDACADCGTIYCLQATKNIGTVEMGPSSGEMPPGFGRG